MLPSGEKEKAGENLILYNTSRLDSGTYICGASNGVESPVDAKIKLKVICECKLSYLSILKFLTTRINDAKNAFHVLLCICRWAWDSGGKGLGSRRCWYRSRNIVYRSCHAISGGKDTVLFRIFLSLSLKFLHHPLLARYIITAVLFSHVSLYQFADFFVQLFKKIGPHFH